MFFPLIVLCVAGKPTVATECTPLNPSYFVPTEEICVREIYDTLSSPSIVKLLKNPKVEVRKIECVKLAEDPKSNS